MLRLSVLLIAAALLADCSMSRYPLTGLPVGVDNPVRVMPVPMAPRV